MTTMLKTIFLTVILNLLWTIHSFACNCEGTSTVESGIKHSDIVFSGKVISRILTKNYDSLGVKVIGEKVKSQFNWRQYPIAVIKVKVDKIYKGKTTSDILTILTPANSGSCGYRFDIGQRYIIYATVNDEVLMTSNIKRRTYDNKTFWTHQCTRTTNWNKTEMDEIVKRLK